MRLDVLMHPSFDQERFLSLLTSQQPQLMLLVRSLVPNRPDADDIIQEVNLYLWRHATELRSAETFPAWVRQTVHYQVLTYRKRQGRERVKFSDALVEELADEFDRMAVQAETRQLALAECLQKLSEKDRQLILRRYESNATTREVAAALGRSAKGIYESLSRIRTALFDCVTRSLSAREVR
jgi:RNA polymerase sigma-70 factor (ECF subfamily)